jgi:hypothetical protein
VHGAENHIEASSRARRRSSPSWALLNEYD